MLILEAEALALRQNNREALRRRDEAAGAGLGLTVECLEGIVSSVLRV